jgi:hypothetical protein
VVQGWVFGFNANTAKQDNGSTIIDRLRLAPHALTETWISSRLNGTGASNLEFYLTLKFHLQETRLLL